jgi:crotonobetaine/carnitine-CoA ligase
VGQSIRFGWYNRGDVAVTAIDWEEMTVARVLAKAVANCPDRAWLVTDDRRVTYSEMDAASNRLARGFAEIGIEPGETVLLMLPNTVDHVTVFCALAKLGAVQVPVNTAYRGTILSHVMNDSGATTIIVDRQFLDRVAFVAAGLENLERLVLYSEDAGDGGGLDLPVELAGRFEALDFESLHAGSDAPLADGPRYHDLIAVMYTSGTTGRSKGVMMTHAYAHEYGRTLVYCGVLRKGDVYYAPLPLFHIAGIWAVIYVTARMEGTAVLPAGFSITSFWDDVIRHKVTVTFLLGAMGNFLYQQPPGPADADNPLRRVLMAPLIPAYEDFERRFGVEISTAYGSSEINCPMVGKPPQPNGLTCGSLNEDLFEVRVADSDDRELPVGEVGELLVRPKYPWITMSGYWRNPEATAAMWRNLWLHSGDTLKRDADGYYYFIDRTKDAMRRRGENISSIEVENEINEHPDVIECAVFAVASEHTEQEVMASIKLLDGRPPDHEGMIRFLEPRMAYFMVPRYLDFVAEIPKTPTGKIQKFVLREKGLTGTTWDRVEAGVKLER